MEHISHPRNRVVAKLTRHVQQRALACLIVEMAQRDDRAIAVQRKINRHRELAAMTVQACDEAEALMAPAELRISQHGGQLQ